MRKRLIAAAAAGCLSLLGVALPATSADASVQACTDNFISGPNNSSGSLQAQSGAVWHKGPGGNYCTIPSRSGLAYIWCWTYSSNGNVWYLARDNSSSQLGWIWAGYVTSTSGSKNRC